MDGELSEDPDNTGPINTDDIKLLQARISELEEHEKTICKDKSELEEEFGQKRAKFREMYLQKEGELNQLRAIIEEKKNSEDEHERLKRELDDARSMICIAECQKEQEIESERRKCQDEIASMQRIMKDALDNSAHLEKEISKMQQNNEKLGEEFLELKNQSGHDREGMFSTVTKSLKQKVGGLSVPNAFLGISNDSTENLEDSMRKVNLQLRNAQEDAEMLRSLVMPLEEEIKALKDKLRSTDDQVQMYEKAFSGLVGGLGSNSLAEVVTGKTPTEVIEHLDDKLASLSQGLQAEKASRSDLEMYVAVLNTQKSVMQEDMDRLKKELEEVCQLLESEKREHAALKQTWQMANDQFLESQRLQIMDLRRMQSVLTTEQQRQIWETKKKDELKHFAKERKMKSIDQMHIQQQIEKEKKDKQASLTPQPRRKLTPNRTSHDEVDRTYYGATVLARSAPENLSWSGLENAAQTQTGHHHTPLTGKHTGARSKRPLERKLLRSLSASDLSKLPIPADGAVKINEANGENVETRSLLAFEDFSSPQKQKQAHSLTRDQFNALSDITPELEARSYLLEGAKAEHDQQSMLGKRLVSEVEWRLLEEELTRAREKLSEPCQMCHNYELQLQQVQKADHERLLQHNLLQRTIDRYKQDIQKEQGFRKDLEQKYSSATENCEKEVLEVFKQVEDSEKMFTSFKNNFTTCQSEVHQELIRLTNQHEHLKQQLVSLRDENDALIGKYIRRAADIHSEDINLPNTTEEMQFQYLQQREEFIITAEQKEQAQSELVFLREQFQSEKDTRDATEEALQQEVDSLKQDAAVHVATRVDLQNEHKLRLELEKLLTKHQDDLQQCSSKNAQIMNEFLRERSEMEAHKGKLESDIQELRSKMQSLQHDLDNSEKVQSDFVKLSQSLQVELEKIRQSDTEVRWQHTDDVRDCNMCKKLFESTKEKHHCNHCGKIFCGECSSKTVSSGPKRRLFRVCNVCHTLLDQETAPFFSYEPRPNN